jgi:hypothetical protein
MQLAKKKIGADSTATAAIASGITALQASLNESSTPE